MATVFCLFDEDGEDINTILIPESIDLSTVIHYSNYSYACHAASLSRQDIDAAIEIMAQCHVIDYKNGVKP